MIDAQRIPFNLRDEAMGLLGLRFGERRAKGFFVSSSGILATIRAIDKG